MSIFMRVSFAELSSRRRPRAAEALRAGALVEVVGTDQVRGNRGWRPIGVLLEDVAEGGEALVLVSNFPRRLYLALHDGEYPAGVDRALYMMMDGGRDE